MTTTAAERTLCTGCHAVSVPTPPPAEGPALCPRCEHEVNVRAAEAMAEHAQRHAAPDALTMTLHGLRSDAQIIAQQAEMILYLSLHRRTPECMLQRLRNLSLEVEALAACIDEAMAQAGGPDPRADREIDLGEPPF